LAGDGQTGAPVIVVLPVEASHMVSDWRLGRLYASVPGTAASYPNTIVTIDSATNTVLSSVFVGSDPGPLALSEDGTALWVGLAGAAAIRKVTLSPAAAPVVGPLCRLPFDTKASAFGAYNHAVSIAVLPGGTDSIALVSSAEGSARIMVLDDCVQRPAGAPMTNITPNLLIPGPAGYVLGLHNSTGDLSVLTLTPDGFKRSDVRNVFNGGSTGGAFYSNGYVFANGGEVIDVSNLNAPVRVGTFAFQGSLTPRDAGHILMVSASSFSGSITLRLLSIDTFTQAGSVAIPADIGTSMAQYYDLVYAGGDAAAFIVSDFLTPSKVVIAHAPLIGSPMSIAGGSDGGMGRDSGADGRSDHDGALGDDPCLGCSFTKLPVYGRRMVFDATRGLIYLAADAGATLYKNSLVTVDATTGAMLSTVPLGKNPTALALSDDATTLWVGISDEAAVQKVTLGNPPVAGPKYSLRSAASSIVVLPGTTASIVVGNASGAMVLDEGVARPAILNEVYAASQSLVLGPPGIVFGYSDLGKLGVLRIKSDGVSSTTFGGFIFGTNIRSILYADNFVYTNDGQVIDVSNPDSPVPAGRFNRIGMIARRGANRLLLLDTSKRPTTLRVLDSTIFAMVASAVLPASAADLVNTYGQMLYLGGDALGFFDYSGNSLQLTIMHARVIGDAP
jgi:DNA-binding beta-propeller fold protein YncE